MDNELFALRQQVYATAAAYHGAGAAWMNARQAGASSEWQALDALLAAGIEYAAVLSRLIDHLTQIAASARNGELGRAQRIRELLNEELALLRAFRP